MSSETTTRRAKKTGGGAGGAGGSFFKMSRSQQPSSSSQQIKSNLEQTKNQSNLLKTQLDTIITQYEQELSKLEKLEQQLDERTKVLEQRELAVSKREESIKQEESAMTKAFEEKTQATLKDLAEREERISNIEKKLSSTTTIETKLGRNQVVKLNIGGTYFTTNLPTLTSVKDTFLTGYFNDHFQPTKEQDDNAYFIDRPSKHFELMLNYLRGLNIKEKVQRMNDDDLNEFIEEVVYYQITPIYDLLPPKGRKLLKTQFGIELEKSLKESEFVKFDPSYCSSKITLESETRARCNQSSGRGSVLGTISNSFKVKLISKCEYLMIGFAPKSINVNKSDNHFKCGYYLYCADGTLYSQNGDYNKKYINSPINNGSIVECLLDKENGTISYIVDGKDYGVAYSNILNNAGGNVELFPAFNVGNLDCTFELLNEQ